MGRLSVSASRQGSSSIVASLTPTERFHGDLKAASPLSKFLHLNDFFINFCYETLIIMDLFQVMALFYYGIN